MKRIMVRFLSLALMLCMLLSPGALGEGLQSVMYGVKLELLMDMMGEVLECYYETCLDEDGCTQEQLNLSLGDGVNAFTTDLFAQEKGNEIVLSIDGGEAVEISAEKALRALISTAFKYIYGSEYPAAVDYVLKGAYEHDIINIKHLITMFSSEFNSTGKALGYITESADGVTWQSDCGDVFNCLASTLTSLAANAEFSALSSALNLWPLFDIPQEQAAFALPALMANLAREMFNIAREHDEDGVDSRVYVFSGDDGALDIEISIKVDSDQLLFDLSRAGGKLDASFIYSGGEGTSYATAINASLNVDGGSCMLYVSSVSNSRYTDIPTFELSAAYTGGEFALAFTQGLSQGYTGELSANIKHGVLDVDVRTITSGGEVETEATLDINASSARLYYNKQLGYLSELLDVSITRESEGLYGADANYEKHSVGSFGNNRSDESVNIEARLDLNARTLDVAGGYSHESVYASFVNAEAFDFGLNYADHALNAYLIQDDMRADLVLTVVGEDGVYGVNCMIFATPKDHKGEPYDMFAADLAINFNKDVMPVYALDVKVYDLRPHYAGGYAHSEILTLTSARTVENGLTLEVTSEQAQVVSLAAKLKDVPGGKALGFTVNTPVQNLSGEIGYDITDMGGGLTIVRPYISLTMPNPNGIGTATIMFDLPIRVTNLPDGSIEFACEQDLGERGSISVKLTLVPLTSYPEHVTGRPITDDELTQLIEKLLKALNR